MCGTGGWYYTTVTYVSCWTPTERDLWLSTLCLMTSPRDTQLHEPGLLQAHQHTNKLTQIDANTRQLQHQSLGKDITCFQAVANMQIYTLVFLSLVESTCNTCYDHISSILPQCWLLIWALNRGWSRGGTGPSWNLIGHWSAPVPSLVFKSKLVTY